jgi:hypothetical protein
MLGVGAVSGLVDVAVGGTVGEGPGSAGDGTAAGAGALGLEVASEAGTAAGAVLALLSVAPLVSVAPFGGELVAAASAAGVGAGVAAVGESGTVPVESGERRTCSWGRRGSLNRRLNCGRLSGGPWR